MTMAPALKIIEIGDKPFVKSAFPDETTYFSTAFVPQPADPQRGYQIVSARTMPRLRQMLQDETVSLIVCHPTFFSPWHWRWISRALFNRRTLQGHVPLVRAFGPQLLRGPVSAPIAVVDQDDFPLINRGNLFLLDRCTAYFKRELPADRWRVFLKTAHANLPSHRFRQHARYTQRLAKLRPLSLGLPLGRDMSQVPVGVPKTSDIFFAGRVAASSWVRQTGFQELLALRERGIIVDVPDSPLPPDEFYRRCASAWLTWSPEGYGWECFRHYEAPVCGSVPVCNLPPLERHRPLVDGEHAVFYPVEPGGLTRSVVEALADKPRLTRMAEAGRNFVMANHTPQALGAYIVETALAAASGER